METEKTEAVTKAKSPLFGKNALLCALSAGVLITLIWFLLSKSMKEVALSIVLVAAGVFALSAASLLLLRKAKKPLRVGVTVVLVVLSLAAFFSATVYTLAPTQLFYPHFDEESYNFLLGVDSAEELHFETKRGAAGGFLIHNAEDGAPLVLYFCGNGESASQRAKLFIEKEAGKFFEGYNFAAVDYPGYGKTDGTPSEESLKELGLAAYDYFKERGDSEYIVVFGYSLGTGVANFTASQRDAAGLMLMAPYADGYDLYNSLVNVFHGPLRALVAYKMESVKFAEDIRERVLVLTSEDDEVISIDSSVRLSEAYAGECEVARFTGLSHNSYWGDDAVLEAIADFLAEVNANE